MNRKLLLLNAALLAVVVYAGFQFRGMWLASKAREAAELNKKVKPQAPPPTAPMALPPPVMASGYPKIAQQLLLDPSRNPNVPIEPPPPPPPPKPVPPLPVYHGMMNFGEGPLAIMSVTANSAHEAIHPGDPIGQFKLVSVSRDGIDLEWDGKVIHKSLDEITDRTVRQQPQDVASAAPPMPAPVPEVPKVMSPLGPGADAGTGTKRCQDGDSMPAGSIQDGYRKVEKPGPFGKMCYWEAVNSTGR